MPFSANDYLAIVTIYQESARCDDAAMLAVARTIRARMARRYESDGTIAGTVLKKYQFSGWLNADYIVETLAAVARALAAMPFADRVDAATRCERAWSASGVMVNTGWPVLYYSPASMSPPDSVPEWASAPNVHFCFELGPFRFYDES